jgi:hypothetical protein
VPQDVAAPEQRRSTSRASRVRAGIDFCLAENTVPVVPLLEGETFVSRR